MISIDKYIKLLCDFITKNEWENKDFIKFLPLTFYIQAVSSNEIEININALKAYTDAIDLADEERISKLNDYLDKSIHKNIPESYDFNIIYVNKPY